MRKTFISFLSLLFVFGTLSAKLRTTQEAGAVASGFFNTGMGVSGMQKAVSVSVPLHLAYSCKNASDTTQAYYYVYNRGTDKGFVIVSGDDRARTVLGYADSGTFDSSAVPVNLKEWLAFYEKEIKSLPASGASLPVASVSSSVSSSKVSAATTVSPLLGNIKWNQGDPYNALCPMATTTSRSVTGCVATAMAQVMKYYNWPVSGTGSNTYTTSTLNVQLTADFSSVQYDWANMTDTYSSSSTDAQKSAVATLMYHCGVAVNMNYGTSSSASSSTMAKALINNFGYDTNLQTLYRDYYTRTEWSDMMKTELNAARPILVSGQSLTEGGHQFICDGYDSNGLFHFNWGWGGASNGYFEISALSPDYQGTHDATGGFDASQMMVVGMQKPSTSSVARNVMYSKQSPTASVSTVARATSFTITRTKLYNYGINTLTGYLGVALYKDNVLYKVLTSSSFSSLSPLYGWSTKTFTTSITSDVADGTYQLYNVYRGSSESTWQILRSPVGTPAYLNATVTSASVSFTTPAVGPALSRDSLAVTGGLYTDKTGRFCLKVTNTGDEYNSYLGVYIVSNTNDTIVRLVYDKVNLVKGETKIFDFTETMNVPAGDYTVTAMYDPSNNYLTASSLSQLGSAISTTVTTAPAASTGLTLTKAISFSNTSLISGETADLVAQVSNPVGFFDNKVVAFIFASTGGSSLTYLGYQEVIFDAAETRNLHFTDPINLSAGQYKIALYYMSDAGSWARLTPSSYSLLNFTLTDATTDVATVNAGGLLLYPNPVKDQLHVKSDEVIRKVKVTSLTGQQVLSLSGSGNNELTVSVQSLPVGAYVVQVETDGALKSAKFIKE